MLGRTNNILCPVSALLAYLAARGDGPGFLFLLSDGRPLTKHSSVREALSAGGVDSSRYAGHSFRIGAATAASTCGLNDSTIQAGGRVQPFNYTFALLGMNLPVFQQSSGMGQLSQNNNSDIVVISFL